jgi:DNA damage-binding protein 1
VVANHALRKANRLEIYEQGPEGLSLLYTRTVYGYITILERFRPAASKTDHLFVGTDRYQYFTCSWKAETKQLQTEQSYVDLADKVLRDSKELDRCRIDPTRRYMTLELYDGVITVLPFAPPSNKRVKRETASNTQTGTLGEPVQVRIEELLTRSSAFLDSDPDSKDNPKLAILWEDNLETPQLKLRELKYYPGGEQATADLETVAELKGDQLDKGVSHLIPVPAPYSGFLILGDHAIRYVDRDLTNVITQPLDDNATIWTCWTQIDDQRWLLADDFGRLFFLMIEIGDFEVSSWRLDPVGTASKAACLVYLDEGFVFVGSHSGDSQVVHIEEEGVRVVQSFANIAPILDFTIMDLGRGAEGGQAAAEFSSGQARIVTASGAWQDGSIRSVRSGVGLEELGTIGELPLITDLWGLSSTGHSNIHDTLLVSFATETRIFRFDSEAAVEEVDDFHHLDFSQPTLFAANLPDQRLVQVCDNGLRATDLDSGMSILEWKPPDAAAKITAACSNSVHLIVVEGGHTLHVFHLASSESNPTVSKTFPLDSQISSVTVPETQSNVCVVSFWQTASIAVLDLHSLDTLQTQSLGVSGSDIPRSVLVANVLPDALPTLFVAMADGTVLTTAFDPVKHTLTNMTRILLGTEPVFFKRLPKDVDSGSSLLSNVFASCEQPSLIYSSEGRIIYSAVNADGESRVCSFHSEAYPGAIAIASPTELKVALIGKERTTQLQTLEVGETVRCLTYQPTAQMFAMGCIRRIMESGVEALLSSVKIADEVTFRELDSVELQDQELVECIVTTGAFETEDGRSHGELFVVGTSLLEEGDAGEDVMKGRILVYEATREKKLEQVTQIKVKGACRSLAMCDGKIVAGLVKTVIFILGRLLKYVWLINVLRSSSTAWSLLRPAAATPWSCPNSPRTARPPTRCRWPSPRPLTVVPRSPWPT